MTRAIIAAALILAGTSRAQDADVVEVYEARIVTTAQEVIDVRGGAYLSKVGNQQVARRIVMQEQEIKSLKEQRIHPAVIGAIALAGAAAAGLGGFFAGKAAAK